MQPQEALALLARMGSDACSTCLAPTDGNGVASSCPSLQTGSRAPAFRTSTA